VTPRAGTPLNHSEPVDNFTGQKRFQSLASELLSPRIEINSGEEADKADRDFTASIASACRLSTCKVTLLDLKNDLPRLAQAEGKKIAACNQGSSM
jgi:hypothetical protein